MVFLCMLPDGCLECLKKRLTGYDQIFDMAISKASCAYWRAKLAIIMTETAQNLTPTEIEDKMWFLFGGIVDFSDFCTSGCQTIAGIFNQILELGQGTLLMGVSAVGRMFNAANIPPNFNVFADDARSVRTASSAGSFVTAEGVNYDGIIAEIEGIRNGRSDGFGSVISGPGSVSASPPSTQDFSQETQLEFIDPYPGVSNVVTLGSDKGPGLLDEIRNYKRKSGSNTAGGGRKSRRHKKRRSTLKRRRMKRRRTRKGKKRRHTRKH